MSDDKQQPKKIKILELFAGTRSISRAFERQGAEGIVEISFVERHEETGVLLPPVIRKVRWNERQEYAANN